MENNEKPNTIAYFSNELRSYLKYVNALDKKMYDLNKDNRTMIGNMIEKYKDNSREFEVGDFARLNQINKLFGCVANDLQMTICKIETCMTIAKMGFGIDDFNLTEEEKRQVNGIYEQSASCLFCFTKNQKGEEQLKMKDDKLYEIIREKSYTDVPSDQKGLRSLFNTYYVSYQKEKEREAKLKEDEERRKKQVEDKLKHEEEIRRKMNGEENNTEESTNTEG